MLHYTNEVRMVSNRVLRAKEDLGVQEIEELPREENEPGVTLILPEAELRRRLQRSPLSLLLEGENASSK